MEIQAKPPRSAQCKCESLIWIIVALGLPGTLSGVNQAFAQPGLVLAWQQDPCLGRFTLALHFTAACGW